MVKVERVLDLYHGVWAGDTLQTDDYVLCADEKTRIQARKRCHVTQAPRPGRPQRVEFEYERHGALACMAAWDVRRAHIEAIKRHPQLDWISALHSKSVRALVNHDAIQLSLFDE